MTVEELDTETLLEWLANATVTMQYYRDKDANFARQRANKAKIMRYKKALKERGVDIPSHQKLMETGGFSKSGSW